MWVKKKSFWFYHYPIDLGHCHWPDSWQTWQADKRNWQPSLTYRCWALELLNPVSCCCGDCGGDLNLRAGRLVPLETLECEFLITLIPSFWVLKIFNNTFANKLLPPGPGPNHWLPISWRDSALPFQLPFTPTSQVTNFETHQGDNWVQYHAFLWCSDLFAWLAAFTDRILLQPVTTADPGVALIGLSGLISVVSQPRSRQSHSIHVWLVAFIIHL